VADFYIESPGPGQFQNSGMAAETPRPRSPGRNDIGNPEVAWEIGGQYCIFVEQPGVAERDRQLALPLMDASQVLKEYQISVLAAAAPRSSLLSARSSSS